MEQSTASPSQSTHYDNNQSAEKHQDALEKTLSVPTPSGKSHPTSLLLRLAEGVGLPISGSVWLVLSDPITGFEYRYDKPVLIRHGRALVHLWIHLPAPRPRLTLRLLPRKAFLSGNVDGTGLVGELDLDVARIDIHADANADVSADAERDTNRDLSLAGVGVSSGSRREDGTRVSRSLSSSSSGCSYNVFHSVRIPLKDERPRAKRRHAKNVAKGLSVGAASASTATAAVTSHPPETVGIPRTTHPLRDQVESYEKGDGGGWSPQPVRFWACLGGWGRAAGGDGGEGR